MKASMLLVSAAALACALSPALAQTDAKKPATPTTPAAPAAPAKPEQPKTDPKADAPKPAVEKAPLVEFKTSMGIFVVELDGEKAPISTANFLTYVNEGYYDGTVFHRVIDKFMIQGGGFTTTGSNPDVTEKRPTHPPIKNEWKNGLKNKRGTIAMARTGDPDSATSQFYINVVDNDGPPARLDSPRGAPGHEAAYAVIGKVVSGMDVVDKIKAVKIGTHMMTDQGGARRNSEIPDAPVVIEKARKLSDEEAKGLKKDEVKAPTPAPAPAPKPAPTTPTAPAPAPKPAGGGGK